jgi:alkylation response protein AidB-like acyl-CoA dehydrogenase
VELTLAPPDDPRRQEVRDWLAAHRHPSARDLAAAGWVAPHWPPPWGQSRDLLSSLVIHDELEQAGISLPENPIGIGWAGPAILAAGTPEQQSRYLPPLLSGEEFWCQLFSEPDAGSDLASVRTRAVRDGDEYVLDGQKIWSTWADHAAFGILIARTDPTAPKHAGISYFILPMATPGITVRPIREMTGEHHFNETFLDGVRIPTTNLLGGENRGWPVVKLTLANERVHLTRGGACWGMGPSTDDFFDLVAKQGGISDAVLRQRAAQCYIEKEILAVLDQRILAGIATGNLPGPQASIKKILADEHGQHLMELAKDLAGPAGLLDDAGPLGAPVDRWHWGFLFSRALTIGGGTSEVQRNILAERVLGLPAEPAS